MANYDYIVLGGGISGLLTSFRLALKGFKVGLFEQGRLGRGASTCNHGIIHSGFLYAKLHPEVTNMCQEANWIFKKSFPQATVCTTDGWYFGYAAQIEEHKTNWESQAMPYNEVGSEEMSMLFRKNTVDELSCVAIPEHIVSPRRILMALAENCLRLGVEIHIKNSVHGLVIEKNKAVGVKLGVQENIFASSGVIICLGLDTKDFLISIRSEFCSQIKSRLQIMAIMNNGRVNTPLYCLTFGGPTLVPSTNNMVLASLYGGKQPSINSDSYWAVPVEKIEIIKKSIYRFFQSDVVHFDTGQFYMHAKTEFSAGRADAWGTEPHFAVINHGVGDGIENLWSLIPGKMTLAVHATHNLVSNLVKDKLELGLPTLKYSDNSEIDKIVEKEVWI